VNFSLTRRLVIVGKARYPICMDIQRLSMGLSQQRVQDQAGMAVLGMVMDQGKEQASALAKLMQSAAPVAASDPMMGSLVDISA